MAPKRRLRTELQKRAKRGFRGYPIATVAFYGPDARRASKVAVGIVADESDDVVDMKRWLSDDMDVRSDFAIGKSIEEFLRGHDVRSVVMTDRIIGCPHEEGVDYPEGQTCPACPYWEGRDRFLGERIADGEDAS
jgi:hypothetical protein